MENETSVVSTTPNTSSINQINGLYSNSLINNAPKKNILYRTSSENEIETQKQE